MLLDSFLQYHVAEEFPGRLDLALLQTSNGLIQSSLSDATEVGFVFTEALRQVRREEREVSVKNSLGDDSLEVKENILLLKIFHRGILPDV